MAHHQRPGLGAPAEAPARVLVHPTADERLAVEQWLLAPLTEPGRARARTEWERRGVAILPLGTQFSAVRIPGRLVGALTGIAEPSVMDQALADALAGGPVICDALNGWRYYVLVPPSVPQTWAQAADDWQAVDTDVLGPGWQMGVPRVDAIVGPGRHGLVASYWSVPMAVPGRLCEPLRVARLIAEAAHRLAGQDL